MKSLDFLAIGDLSVDAFIKLKEAKVHCNLKNEDCELCVKFASKIPFESVTEIFATGNSSNASISASRLGIESGLIANIGRDENGNKSLEVLKKEGVHTEFVNSNPEITTNYHYILWYESERTILVHHREHSCSLPKISENPKWVYLSSVGTNSYEYHQEILNFLNGNKEIKLAFQPGTFQISLGVEKMKGFYEICEVCVVNLTEAQTILGLNEERDIKKLLSGIKGLGPKIAIITDSENGAYLLGKEKSEVYHLPVYGHKKSFEKTGCGDAFASTFVSGLILGKNELESFVMAGVNAFSVSQSIGPHQGLLGIDQINDYLSKSPDDYKPTVI